MPYVGLALMLACLGCRSRGDYRAADLPPELRGASQPSPRMVDLSRVAQHTIDANLVYPGDVLEVTIGTGLEQERPAAWPLRVTDQGYVKVPLVGPVRCTGMALTEVEQVIRQASIDRDIYRNPHVSVLMKQRKTIQVRVVGAVKEPGVFQLPASGSDLLAAIVASGGLAPDAGTMVEIRHPNRKQLTQLPSGQAEVALASFVQSPESPPRTVHVDLVRALGGDADLHMEDGSVVMVMPKPAQSISVIGLVRRPDTYELPVDEKVRVLDAIALAGGVTVSLADRVRIIRQVDEEPFVIDVSLKRAKLDGRENLEMIPGDTISVEETPATFVVETIRSFIRFGFSSAIPGL